MPNLLQSLTGLALALDVAVDAETAVRFEAKIAWDDLDDPTVVPPWLTTLLDALAAGRLVPHWQAYDSSGDLTDPLTFFCTLDTILPVTIEDIGGRMTLTAPKLGLEAVVVTEGYSWLIRRASDSEPTA